jgi:hypothetical protein
MLKKSEHGPFNFDPLISEERLEGLDPETRLKGLDPDLIEAWLNKQRRDH